MIHTETDIKRRKSLTIDAINKLDKFWKNDRTSIKLKLKIFNVFVESIFLYNSELWSMNKTLEGSIDSFHRRLLRRALNIRWPKKITSNNLSNITKQIPWSKKVTHRRLRWFGHMIRLPEGAPAKLALKEAERDVPMPRGRRKTTWLETMKKQISNVGLTYSQAKGCAIDRDCWRAIVNKNRPVWAEEPGN
jgi:hypothetical protein